MDPVRASKLLSYVLRHDLSMIGITLDQHGWVPVRVLLDGMRRNGHRLTRAELLELVVTSDKQRFALDAAQDRIRANQGHSVRCRPRSCPDRSARSALPRHARTQRRGCLGRWTPQG